MDFYFTYWLRGFKKAGTEAFDIGFHLNFRIENYSYGFSLPNNNNHQSFIKKLYHEQLSKKEINKIVELFYENIMDDIEKQMEQLNQQEHE